MKTAMKHINAIFAGVMFICLLLPYVTAEVMGHSESKNFFSVFSEDLTDTVWMVILLIGIAALAASKYIGATASYVKYISIAAPVIVIVSAFLSVSDYMKDIYMDVFSYGIGFWLLIIVAVLAIAVAVIKMLGLKGNPVFDAINED